MTYAKTVSTSISDIARLAGVSKTTVSMVINGRAERYRISQETQARVKAAVAQTGYVPDTAGRDTSIRRRTIGLVMAEIATLDPQLLAGLAPALAGAGYRLVVATTAAEPAAVRDQVAALFRSDAAGIFCLADTSGVKPGDPGIAGPLVNLVRPSDGMLGVFHNDRQGGRLLARHLLNNGHRRIAGIRLTDSNPALAEGFRETCIAAGVQPVEFKTVADFMAVARDYTGVACASGSILMRLYIRAAGAGLRIPADLSVVAADDLDVAGKLSPPVVALDRNARKLGEAAAEIMLAALQGEEVENQRVEWELTPGESVAAPAKTTTKPTPAPQPKPAAVTTPPASAPRPAPTQAPRPAPAPIPAQPMPKPPQPIPASPAPAPVVPPVTAPPQPPEPGAPQPVQEPIPCQPPAPAVPQPAQEPTPPQPPAPPAADPESPSVVEESTPAAVDAPGVVPPPEPESPPITQPVPAPADPIEPVASAPDASPLEPAPPPAPEESPAAAEGATEVSPPAAPDPESSSGMPDTKPVAEETTEQVAEDDAK